MLLQIKQNIHFLKMKVKIIPTKRLTKDLINTYKFLNGAKYFTSEI